MTGRNLIQVSTVAHISLGQQKCCTVYQEGTVHHYVSLLPKPVYSSSTLIVRVLLEGSSNDQISMQGSCNTWLLWSILSLKVYIPYSKTQNLCVHLIHTNLCIYILRIAKYLYTYQVHCNVQPWIQCHDSIFFWIFQCNQTIVMINANT